MFRAALISGIKYS